MGRTLVLALAASALFASGRAHAAPGDGSAADIDMEPDAPAGSAATPAPAPPPTPPPPPATDGSAAPADGSAAEPAIVKDPKVAKKWLTAAQTLVTKADALAKKGKADEAKESYDNAIVAYGKALEAGDDVNVYFALGALQDKLGNFPEAIKNYKIVQAATKGVRPDIAKQLTAKLEAATGKVGLVTLVITPDGADVTLNGTAIGKSPLTGPLVLLPGAYKVTISEDGYVSKEDIDITVEAGAEAEKKLDLDPVPVEIHTKHEEVYVPPPAAKPHKPSKLPLIAGGGVTVIGLGGGIVLGELATRWHNKFVAPDSNLDTRLDAQQFGRQEARAATACFAGAIIGAAFTGYWYGFHYRGKLVYEKQDDSENPNAPKIVLAPWVQPDVGGLAALGRF